MPMAHGRVHASMHARQAGAYLQASMPAAKRARTAVSKPSATAKQEHARITGGAAAAKRAQTPNTETSAHPSRCRRGSRRPHRPSPSPDTRPSPSAPGSPLSAHQHPLSAVAWGRQRARRALQGGTRRNDVGRPLHGQQLAHAATRLVVPTRAGQCHLQRQRTATSTAASAMHVAMGRRRPFAHTRYRVGPRSDAPQPKTAAQTISRAATTAHHSTASLPSAIAIIATDILAVAR